MKKSLIAAAIALAATQSQAASIKGIDSGAALLAAMTAASADASITRLVFTKDAEISLSEPAIFTGTQDITLVGKGAYIDGSSAGSFEVIIDDEGLPAAVTEDGTLIFNTPASVTIRDLTVANSATRGVVVNIPSDASDTDVSVTLRRVEILDSALFGLHLDDNADDFDDGSEGSSVGFDLEVSASAFIGNGTGALDFDGVRVDERGEGDIYSWIANTFIDGNGGDGIELDEAGNGDVYSTMRRVSLSGNGFFNEEDLDDGFDIDEAGEGSIFVEIVRANVKDNMDEGLDFDEEDGGDVHVRLRNVVADNNADEGVKVDEEDDGDIRVDLVNVDITNGGDDGMQLTEIGEGKIVGALRNVVVVDNAKAGIKAEQWIVEDESEIAEPAGSLKVRKVVLSGNDKDDQIVTNNVVIK